MNKNSTANDDNNDLIVILHQNIKLMSHNFRVLASFGVSKMYKHKREHNTCECPFSWG